MTDKPIRTTDAAPDSSDDWQYHAIHAAYDKTCPPKHPDDSLSIPAIPAVQIQQEWTVAYYLAATKVVTDMQPGTTQPRQIEWGSAEKAERLKQMAAETKDKPVTVLVDVLREKDGVKKEKERSPLGEEASHRHLSHPQQ